MTFEKHSAETTPRILRHRILGHVCPEIVQTELTPTIELVPSRVEYRVGGYYWMPRIHQEGWSRPELVWERHVIISIFDEDGKIHRSANAK